MMNRCSFRFSLACIAAYLTCAAGCHEKSDEQKSSSPPEKTAPAKKTTKQIRPPKPADGIAVEDGRRFRHQLSQTLFRLPDGWNAGRTWRRAETEFIRIADTKSTAKALITWTPLAGTLERAVRLRVASRRRAKSYGTENVSEPKSVTIGPKTGWRLDMKVTVDRDPTKREIQYYFATAPGTKSRWIIGITVTIDQTADDDVARMLVNHFTWIL